MPQKALFAARRVRNVPEYLNVLLQITRGRGRVLWFRGQTNAKNRLVPGLARRRGRDWLSAEAMLINRFRQNAVALLPPMQRSDWDWLLLMQHHGVPTRLLDWTENPLAGLYFAVVSTRGRDTKGVDGCVWVLDPVALNREANISTASADIPTLEVDSRLRDYLPDEVARAVTPRPPVAVLAQRMFPRLVAQSGVFTLIHNEPTPLEQVRQSAYISRIIVPGTAKERITRQLTSMGTTRLALFPELESVASIVRDLIR